VTDKEAIEAAHPAWLLVIAVALVVMAICVALFAAELWAAVDAPPLATASDHRLARTVDLARVMQEQGF
jgi:hypothetical protein